MLKALIEMLGAFSAAAPVSEGAEGRSQRIVALMLIVGVLAIGAWFSLQP